MAKSRKKYDEKYRKSNKGKAAKARYYKKYKQNPKHKELNWKAQLKFRYNITLEDYDILLKSQNNKCAICESDSPGAKKNRFSIDHDHESGKIRGLLCDNCNVGLGRFNDNINNLIKSIEYLKLKR